MNKVWIVTIKLDYGPDEFIESVFDSYESAHIAAEDIWRRYNSDEDGYLWKRGEVNRKDFCKMTIYYTDKKTSIEWCFATIKIEPYIVRH